MPRERKIPKEHWARLHPEYFPLDINRASMDQLIRVPGAGKITANRILNRRKTLRIKCIEDIGRPTALLKKAGEYLCF